MGVVKLSATASPSGRIERAVNQDSMAPRAKTARTLKSPMRFVLKTPKPERKSQGDLNMRPKRLRKKAISKGCRNSDA